MEKGSCFNHRIYYWTLHNTCTGHLKYNQNKPRLDRVFDPADHIYYSTFEHPAKIGQSFCFQTLFYICNRPDVRINPWPGLFELPEKPAGP